MTTDAKERTDPQQPAAVALTDLEEGARTAPLTDEVKAHLKAAGHLADKHYVTLKAMIESAIQPLVEANRHVGFDVRLTDEQVGRIVMAVRGALTYGDENVVEPIFARLRGERPYVEDGDRPHLSLSEEQARDVITDLYRIGFATALDKDSDEEEIRRRLDAVSKLQEDLADRLCEATGIPVHDGTIQEFLDDARPFKAKAAKLGREAVDTDEEEA